MSDFVHMRHPDIEGIAGPVTREAFDLIHEAKGWTLVDEADVIAAADAEVIQAQDEALTVDDIDAIRKRDDLDALAIRVGVDPTESSNMDDLRQAIKVHQGLVEASN